MVAEGGRVESRRGIEGVLLSMLPKSLWQAKEEAGQSVRSLVKVQRRDSSGWARQCNGDVEDPSY